MSDYISRANAIQALVGITAYNSVEEIQAACFDSYARANGWLGGVMESIAALAEGIPAADVRPVKEGHWIRHISDLFPADRTIECDQCHAEQPSWIDDNFCPNCGADMRTIGQRLSDISTVEDLFPELTAEEKAENKAEAKRMIGGADG